MYLFLILFVIILLIIYVKLKYFTLYGPIPGMPPQFFVGNMLQTGFMNGATYATIFATLKKRFGDVYQIWFGPTRYIAVCDTDDIQHIFTNRHIYDHGVLFVERLGVLFHNSLISARGAAFKRHGAATMSLFRRSKIICYFDLIINCVDILLDKWRTQSRDHIYTDIVEQSQNLLLQLFGFIAFDFDLGTLNEHEQRKKRNELSKAMEDYLSIVNIVFHAPAFVSKSYLALNPRYQKARATIEKYVYEMIEQELKKTEESRAQRKRTSLIASLVASLQLNEQLEATKPEEDKRGLSRSEIFDNISLFLITGFETTSTALSWLIHSMSKNPRVQQKIKAELRGESGCQDLTLERLDSLIYLDNTMKESFRYQGPAGFTTRRLMTDDRLPKTGVQLYKDDEVLIPISSLAKDPQLWSIDPELFYPERFLNEDENHAFYALIPFGSGHRQCVGQDLARFELKVIAARLMQHVTFLDGGSDVNAGGYVNGLTVKPKKIGVAIHFDS